MASGHCLWQGEGGRGGNAPIVRALTLTLARPLCLASSFQQWTIPDFGSPDGEPKLFSDTFTVGTYPW